MGHDRLQANLLDPLQPPRATDKRSAPLEGLECTGAGDLKAAMAVAADGTGAGSGEALQQLRFMTGRDIENQLEQLLVPGNLEHPPPLPGETEPFRQHIIHSPGGHIQIGMSTVNRDLPPDRRGNKGTPGHTFIDCPERLEEQRMVSHNQSSTPGGRLFQNSRIQLQGHQHLAHLRRRIAQLQTDGIAGQGQRRRRQRFNAAGNLLHCCKQDQHLFHQTKLSSRAKQTFPPEQYRIRIGYHYLIPRNLFTFLLPQRLQGRRQF